PSSGQNIYVCKLALIGSPFRVAAIMKGRVAYHLAGKFQSLTLPFTVRPFVYAFAFCTRLTSGVRFGKRIFICWTCRPLRYAPLRDVQILRGFFSSEPSLVRDQSLLSNRLARLFVQLRCAASEILNRLFKWAHAAFNGALDQ